MSAFAIASPIRWDGYDYAEASDRRFYRLLVSVAVPFIAIVILSLIYHVEGVKAGGGTYAAPATVELISAPQAEVAEKIEEPAPAKEDSKQAPKESAPKTADKPIKAPTPSVQPTPTPVPVESAKDVAKRSGVLAFAQQLNEMRNKGDAVTDQTLSPNVLSSKGAASSAGGAAGGGGDGAAAAAAAAAGSSGIGGAGTEGVTTTQSGTGLGKRRTTKIDSPVGFGRDTSKAGEGGTKGKGGRTLDEIQLAFDRAQGSFYAMYVRAQRENAGLAGKVIISVTIGASGAVTEAHIVSSELGDPELERKIIARVQLMNFGPKDVPSYTYPNYPITFKPPA
jgi:TonB family protein